MKFLLILLVTFFINIPSLFAEERNVIEEKVIEKVEIPQEEDLKEEEEGCSDVYSSLVFVENDRDILMETRPNQIIYPASLVKLMTLYLTFEALEKGKLNPYQILTFSARGEEISKINKYNTLHIVEGDEITVRDVIRAVIVKSMNEAAVTLAEAISGNEWDFSRKMNEKAKKLGMINTSFRNASGLHEEGQYTTVYDLARLSKAIKNDFPGYYHLFSLKEFQYGDKKYYTHNHVLNDYSGAEGLKTGFTNASGFNLIAAARKNGKRVVSVLAGCSTYQRRDEFTKELLNQAFDELSKSQNPKVEIKLNGGFDYVKDQGYKDYEREIRFGDKIIDINLIQ